MYPLSPLLAQQHIQDMHRHADNARTVRAARAANRRRSRILGGGDR